MTNVTSPVTGVVRKLEKQRGDAVAAGEVILVLESMKMEIAVEAPVAGTLAGINVAEGDSVGEGAVVARIV